MFVYCEVVVYRTAWKFRGTERMGMSHFLTKLFFVKFSGNFALWDWLSAINIILSVIEW